MPAFERRDRYQTAVLWEATGAFDDYANALVGSPVQIQLKWKDEHTESVGPDGQTVTLDATAIVDRLIPIGSRLWPGTLAEWYGQPGSGGDDSGVRVVKTYKIAVDIKARNRRYSLGLMRWRSKT